MMFACPPTPNSLFIQVLRDCRKDDENTQKDQLMTSPDKSPKPRKM